MRIFYKIVSAFMLACGPLAAMADVTPAASEILSGTLEKLKDVHTARYTLTEHLFHAPDDSLFIREEKARYIECENPADTTGASKYVILYEDGRLNTALDSCYRLFPMGDFYEKSNREHSTRVFPAFYNRVTRLCDWLLEPADNKIVTVKDLGDMWQVDALVKDSKLILFQGYPNVMEMSPDGVNPRFALRVDKSTMMPVWTSYYSNLPVSRFEESVSDVELNPFPVDSFSVAEYVGDRPVYEKNESREAYKEWRKALGKRIVAAKVPSDTLTLLDGRQVSLADNPHKAKVVFFATTQCGWCHVAFPIINKVYETVPTDSVDMWGVMMESIAQPQGVIEVLNKMGLNLPMALNNGRFYEHFFPQHLSPAVVVVSPEGKVVLYQNGVPTPHEKLADKIYEAIDRAFGKTSEDKKK
ncbi:MAG: TlpA family protein disulfide reductase [Duncaniella sp.]|nr:TlpA family protein disulfide reductase [Duncaniella sp.]